jgi:glycosyltransferase involved in cell wall biosynthesis
LESAACGCVPIVSSRHSYEELFNKSEKPYIEIPNFLDPKLVVDTLNQIEKQNNFEIYSKIVLEYEWEKGFTSSLTAIQELIGK